jgi:hypothetical protein
MMDTSRHRLKSEACMDGAYDSEKSYGLLGGIGINPIIKPRRDARADGGLPERHTSVITFKTLGEREWGRVMGYGRRWIAETSFATFKRLYGGHCMAKGMESISGELMAKAYTYITW